MKKIKGRAGYFTGGEKLLWGASALVIVLMFCVFDGERYLTLTASLVGVTSLIFNAKGNPVGQALMVVFSVLYGIISLSFVYYGEMLTYLGMTLPMAVVSLVTWLKNPYQGNRAQVAVNRISRRETGWMLVLTAAVTVVFYFILAFFHTSNLLPSTVSVTTSFLAAYLTFRRSPYYAVAYAANDVVLIVLWTLASVEDAAYISVVVCFVTFLVNDLYGFLCWRRMAAQQAK